MGSCYMIQTRSNSAVIAKLKFANQGIVGGEGDGRCAPDFDHSPCWDWIVLVCSISLIVAFLSFNFKQFGEKNGTTILCIS